MSPVPNDTAPPRTDVAVIGGGPAGAAVAATLRRAGVDVAVVDAVANPALSGRSGSTGGEDFRVGEAAPPGTERMITDVFRSDNLAFDPAQHLPTYANRAAWGGAEPVVTDFMLNPFGHGWHLDRAAFDRGLLAAASRLGARMVTGARVRSAERHSRGWDLCLEPVGTGVASTTERILVARFVCDASGRRAAFARAHGARLTREDRLVAVVGLLGRGSPGGDPDSTTLVEAVEDGWWYTAAIPGGGRVVAMFTDGDLLDAVHLRSAAGLTERLGDTRHVRGAVRDHGGELSRPPVLTAAGTAWLERPAGDGWMAAGDAAAALDPLSSQGILSALVMGQRAGSAIVEWLSAPGRDEPIERYVSDYGRLVERYQAEQSAAYRMEGRWPASPFWSRRRS